MKEIFCLIFCFTFSLVSFCQTRNDVNVIRKLNIANAVNLVKRDTVALAEYVSKDFLVNRPGGKIGYGLDEIIKGIRDGRVYLQFDVVTDTVYFINKKTAISMGGETVAYAMQGEKGSAPIKRRFTNFWIFKKGRWILAARHSAILCSDK